MSGLFDPTEPDWNVDNYNLLGELRGAFVAAGLPDPKTNNGTVKAVYKLLAAPGEPKEIDQMRPIVLAAKTYAARGNVRCVLEDPCGGCLACDLNAALAAVGD